MTVNFKNMINLDKKIQSLMIIKSTAWVMFGISSMFSVGDLTSNPTEGIWLNPLIRFGLAVAFLLAGLFFQKNKKRNVFLVMIVVLVDVFVSLQQPIGLFDLLMLLFDLVLYWFVFIFLKQAKI